MNLELSDKEKAALRAEFCKGFTEGQAETCFTFCRLRGLIPGKHVIFSLRSSKEWDELVGAKVQKTKIVFMTTIDAARLIALRSQQYGGQAPEQYLYLDENGSPSIVSEIPLPKLPLIPNTTPLPREPWAVRSTVYRKDFSAPMTSIARFDAYAATYKTQEGPQLTEMWVRRGPEMLAKCSEMLSLRKAFPEELANLYIDLELKNENEEAPVTPASVSVPTSVPVPPSAPPVNQKPAEATDTPRPGETKTEYHVTEVPATLPKGAGDTLKVVPKPDAKTTEIIKEAIPKIEEFLENPKVQETLAEKGLKVNQAAIDQLKKDVGLKAASEITPKRRGGRPRKESPNNGQAPVPGEITQADIDNPGPPVAQITEEDKQAGADFVESLDPTPTKEEQAGFTARVRALSAAGALNPDLKNYILNVGKKDDPKQLTVSNWNTALDQLESALAESKDKLKEVTKNAPLPDKF